MTELFKKEAARRALPVPVRATLDAWERGVPEPSPLPSLPEKPRRRYGRAKVRRALPPADRETRTRVRQAAAALRRRGLGWLL